MQKENETETKKTKQGKETTETKQEVKQEVKQKEEKKLNIYQKLSKIQTTLKAPKNQYNNFGKYKYRSCEDILEGIKPLLEMYSVALVVKDDLELLGDRYYIKATAKLIDCETGEAIENTAYAREDDEKKGMDSSQVTGATSSYARKYCLNGLLCIDDTKDTDTEEYQKQSQNQPKQEVLAKEARITSKQKEIISSVYSNVLDRLLEKYHIKSLDEMSSKDASLIIERYTQKKKENENNRGGNQ